VAGRTDPVLVSKTILDKRIGLLSPIEFLAVSDKAAYQ
jgi:hypothetical protein